MVLWDVRAASIAGMLSNDAINVLSCLSKPLVLLLKPTRPCVQQEHTAQDTCMPYAVYRR